MGNTVRQSIVPVDTGPGYTIHIPRSQAGREALRPRWPAAPVYLPSVLERQPAPDDTAMYREGRAGLKSHDRPGEPGGGVSRTGGRFRDFVRERKGALGHHAALLS